MTEMFRAGMIVDGPFRFPDAAAPAGIVSCVVIASHPQGILLTPIVRDRTVDRRWSVRIASRDGIVSRHVMCDCRNVVYRPDLFLMRRRDRSGRLRFAVGQVPDVLLDRIRDTVLACCDAGEIRDLVIRPDAEAPPLRRATG